MHDEMMATSGTTLIQNIELGLKTDDEMKAYAIAIQSGDLKGGARIWKEYTEFVRPILIIAKRRLVSKVDGTLTAADELEIKKKIDTQLDRIKQQFDAAAKYNRNSSV